MNEKIILNTNQKKAAEYGKGPVLVVAGAGTGKTRVITERIRWILEKKLAKPQEILALTFTEKAAEEMLSRVDEIMPLGYEEPWLMTFHAFADRVLRQEALEIGLDPSYKILTPPEQWLLICQNLFKFDLKFYRPLGNPTKFIRAMLTLFSRAQDEAVGVGEFLEYGERTAYSVKGIESKKDIEKEKITPSSLDAKRSTLDANQEEAEKLMELAKAYETYQNLKIENSALDFGDLILWTLKLFRDRPSVLKKYQKQFKYILADEFQDTNYAQYQIIKLLSPSKNNPNLMVCADDDQAIYRFRGAAVYNVLDFKKDYPQAGRVTLVQNYRSGQKLLDRAYQLIQNNNPDRLEEKLRIDKKLIATRGDGVEPQILAAQTAEGEADQVVKKITDLVSSDDLDYTWKDFAILARANNHLDPFVAALRRNKIPYQLLGNRGLFDQEEVRHLISFLRVVADPEDSASLFNLLHIPQLGVAPEEIVKLLNEARKQRKPLIEVTRTSVAATHESPNSEAGHAPQLQANLENLVKLIDETQKTASKTPVSRLLYNFITNIGYMGPYMETESYENQLKIKNINLFFDRVKEFEGAAENPNVFEFVNYLDLLMEAGENPAQAEIEDIDTVNLLTVHSAKGLEFPAVLLVNLVNDRFPTRNRRDPIPLPDELIKETLPEGDPHLLEERRLFYVGCTRAKDLLFLSYAKNYGGKREKRPSGFIKELGLKFPDETVRAPGAQEAPGALRSSGIESLSLFDVKPIISTKPSKPTRPRYISYSQLETFNQCPLKYKYRYVLGIPTAPSHVLNFGQTLHRTLRDFHRAQVIQKDLDFKALLGIYENHWIGDGYDSVEHRQQRFEEGKEVLHRYFKVHQERFGRPIHLEKKFTIKIEGMPLIGSIDRIDQIEGEQFEIIDYKTGSEKDQRAVDRNTQLTIYALASQEALSIQPDVLSLYFLESNKKVSTRRTPEQLEKERQNIVETLEKIAQSEFPAKVSMLCRYCDYNKICPEYKVGS